MRVVPLLAVLAAAFACSSSDDPAPAGSGGSQTVGVGGTGAASGGSGGSTGGSGGSVLSCAQANTLPGLCDLVEQDCDDGMECHIVLDGVNGVTACVSASSGNLALGRYCGSASDCAPGLQCLNRHCAAFCCPDDDGPCEGYSCDLPITLANGRTYVCSGEYAACSVFEPGSCGSDDCHFDDTTGLLTCVTPAVMQASEGGPCTSMAECRDGQGCDAGSCRFHCDASTWMQSTPGRGGCPSGRTCNDRPTGYGTHQVCVP